MFFLPNPPPASANLHETADFIEWSAWRHGVFSAREANQAIDQLDDNSYNEGCDDDSDETSEALDEVFNEIERREQACGGGYPFRIAPVGNVLRCGYTEGNPRHLIYRYLLLSTRLNMKSNRVHAGVDGALLLEELAAQVMRNYLGNSRATSEVFGTAASGGFPAKVDRLCKRLGEGGGYQNADGGRSFAKDAKLDVVTWVPFTDGQPGKLIVFTQCKTGSSWMDSLGDLSPEAFFKTWTRERGTVLTPLRAFCVAEAANRTRWQEVSNRAGLFLDRCRIIDFSQGLKENLIEQIRTWTSAAYENTLAAMA